ncbi:MAG: Hpt domain-containing protein [Bacteroidales bacterium]|nr:Hpt domain-containing protein [Bacteroidales bacterium]MDD4604420.1 Hpt domain-containing protein [Bacteroidales bacterium]
MIDRQKFNENFQYFEKDVIVEIIDIFISEYEDRFNNLRQNVVDRDFIKLKFNAHSLKGVIANFMDPVTIELSKKLDEMAKEKREAGLTELFADLEKNSEKLLEELKQYRLEYST